MSDRTTKLKGQANKVKGSLKETAGRITGNDRMQASGRADMTKGKGQVAVGSAGRKVQKIAKAIIGK